MAGITAAVGRLGKALARHFPADEAASNEASLPELTTDNIHDPIETGPPVGREIW